MSNKKGKLPIVNGPKVERQVAVVSPQRAVIATENPIQRWDEESKQVVNEVLLMDGIVYRGGRDQIPIVDSHNDKTVRNIFGSIQHMRVDAASGELYGVPVFASDEEAQKIATRMAEGHITDFSITGQPLETLFVQRGQSYTTSRGMVIDGPALIHTKWQPQNASICATGADEQSTVRRSYTDLNRKVIRMNPELLAKLTAMGLPDGVVDPDQVLAWVIGKVGEESTEEATEPVMNMAEDKPAEEVPAVVPPVEIHCRNAVRTAGVVHLHHQVVRAVGNQAGDLKLEGREAAFVPADKIEAVLAANVGSAPGSVSHLSKWSHGEWTVQKRNTKVEVNLGFDDPAGQNPVKVGEVRVTQSWCDRSAPTKVLVERQLASSTGSASSRTPSTGPSK